MKNPKTPIGAWTSIILDFIVKLPKFRAPITKVIYNSILIITNRPTKYKYFILYKKVSLSEDLFYIIYKYVVGNYELPEKIISDQNKIVYL